LTGTAYLASDTIHVVTAPALIGGLLVNIKLLSSGPFDVELGNGARPFGASLARGFFGT
jgi:hypothetical protein